MTGLLEWGIPGINWVCWVTNIQFEAHDAKHHYDNMSTNVSNLDVTKAMTCATYRRVGSEMLLQHKDPHIYAYELVTRRHETNSRRQCGAC